MHNPLSNVSFIQMLLPKELVCYWYVKINDAYEDELPLKKTLKAHS